MSATVGWMIAAGLAVIAGLAWVAWRELTKVKAQDEAKAAATQARLANLQVSVDAIARAVMSEQCDVSEGALRLKPLLDAVDTSWLQRSDLRAILVMAEALADQPIKDARNALDKQTRMRLDLERMKLESEHAESVRAACAVLVRGDA
ncbi:DUF2489 domain-containing protein [Litorivicinus lipolyticus]|uniref:DUF2489 domain-containing protein n=1 Tax=Litorivicinus lipolyticus TaxID=418701 RepID=A0A5Q2QGI7_9GAMM|nr:DUF2489 domain-containing protein [Litorivicinus lipolyticus]QGG81097.1 DUF2489 domain-containing protein [Litorivicinus lipolyticus]